MLPPNIQPRPLFILGSAENDGALKPSTLYAAWLIQF